MAWIVYGEESLTAAWLTIPVVLFLVLLVLHSSWRTRHHLALRSMEFYRRGLDRVKGEWIGVGATGERFRDPDHPYAEDLDLFGDGSLFQLLCSARTQSGEAALANWLLTSACPHEIRQRQEAIAELSDNLDLREELARLGEDVRTGMQPQELRDWGAAPGKLASPAHAVIAAGIAAASVSSLIAWITTSAGGLYFVLAMTLGGVWFLVVGSRVLSIIRDVRAPSRDLELFSRLLSRIEKEAFVSEKLVALRSELVTENRPPSAQVRRLQRRVEILDASLNQLFLPVSVLLLWPLQFACAIDRWRVTCGPGLGRWIDAVGEFEALMALASFHFEHEDNTFPHIEESGAIFEGVSVGHPLLPGTECTRNDVRLAEEPRLLIVSGSNMSGKSTLLRAVGTNLVLALAGASVRARSLRLSSIALGASIRVRDSLQDGQSRFYAEIKQVGRIVKLTQDSRPVMFLMDEIFHGTNSHDRRIGAEAVLRSLIDAEAIGIVTTHDLALTKVSESLGDCARNVHFRDEVEDGVLVFDYRMYPGVVTESNALELMKAVGLDVGARLVRGQRRR